MSYPMKLRQLNLYRVMYTVPKYTDTTHQTRKVLYMPGFSTRQVIELVKSEHARPGILVTAKNYTAKLIAPLGHVLS